VALRRLCALPLKGNKDTKIFQVGTAVFGLHVNGIIPSRYMLRSSGFDNLPTSYQRETRFIWWRG
jgi:hypothetical protein